jgi:hypothetical protein
MCNGETARTLDDDKADLQLELTDAEGDALAFLRTVVDDTDALALSVSGSLFAVELDGVSYAADQGLVTVDGVDADDDEVEGTFRLAPARRALEAAKLQVLCAQSGIGWEGDEPLELPDAVEALLVDDELRSRGSRAAVRLLWAALLEVYASEEAALRAVALNSVVVLPYLNRPWHITGSWEVLLEMMGSEAAAREVIELNPGVLTVNPLLLRSQSKAVVLATARGVSAVQSFQGLFR